MRPNPGTGIVKVAGTSAAPDERDERHADEQHDLANRVPLEEGGRAAE